MVSSHAVECDMCSAANETDRVFMRPPALENESKAKKSCFVLRSTYIATKDRFIVHPLRLKRRSVPHPSLLVRSCFGMLRSIPRPRRPLWGLCSRVRKLLGRCVRLLSRSLRRHTKRGYYTVCGGMRLPRGAANSVCIQHDGRLAGRLDRRLARFPDGRLD